MDKDEKSSGGVPGGGLLVIALLAAGAFVATKPPLESSRPSAGETRVEIRVAAQDTDARLWQDPFGAVSKARERSDKPVDAAGKDRARHSEMRFTEELARRAGQAGEGGVFVVAVMLYGGPYAEQVESRRRMRYAVLAGLQSRGFYPSDNEHLGYFYPYGGEGPAKGVPETIPFETFERKRRPMGLRDERSDDACEKCRVVVLWLDSAPFSLQPLRNLAALAQRLAPAGANSKRGPRVRWRVLGPATSDDLRALIEEAGAKDFNASGLQRFDFRFLSSGATARDDTLLEAMHAGAAAPGNAVQSGKAGNDKPTVSSFLQQRNVELVRTIGTDDLLVSALKTELKRRGLTASTAECSREKWQSDPAGCPSAVAIISEGDTLYGRGLRHEFGLDNPHSETGFDAERWSYFRGIDGRLPGDAAPQSFDSRGKKDSKPEATEQGWYGAYTERPEGTGQFDYLRRQAAQIRLANKRRMAEHGSMQGLRAIGVMGTDAYDKLLVLQATQPEVPQALYFTTDLDARLFHSRELEWTRNLIVASSFGLTLSDELQRGVAPFRDSYQTAMFLATLMLVSDIRDATANPDAGPLWKQQKVSGWFQKPRLFEISRSGPFDFSERGDEPGVPCSVRQLDACNHIHPDSRGLWPKEAAIPAGVAVAGLMAVLALPALMLNRGLRRRLRRFVGVGGRSFERRLPRRAAVLAGVLALVVGPAVLVATHWGSIAAWLTEDGKGKPLSVFLGISPWPTYAIRLLVLVLCVHFVSHAWNALRTNVSRIARDFHLGSTRRRLEALLAQREQQMGWRRRLAAMFEMRFYRPAPQPQPVSSTGLSAEADDFWIHYIVQNRLGARVLRTTACVLAMMLVCFVIWHGMGEYVPVPQRGALSSQMHLVTLLLGGLATLFLLFFVADAAMLCVLFVRGLRRQTSSWPKAALKVFEDRLGLDRRFLDDWIDLEFVARRTRCVATLIYYPFIALSLLILARSSFFDDWYAPKALYVVVGVSVAIVLGCALALRRGAEASRRHALTRMREAILRSKGDSGQGLLVGQLEALRERIERLREGAFAPYSQQPLLKALLLPVLTFGGTSLFDYLTLANL